ncbi:MAG: HAD family hydrolase [Nocardioides sp.]|nr:HAD family hydrolase [Nocardioides sp.]
MIRAVLFDLDDTLLDHTSAADAAVVEWARERGVGGTTEELAARWKSVSDRHYARYQARELTFSEQRRARVREFLGETSSDAGADAAFAGYLTRYEAGWATFPDARPTLERVRVAGLVAAVLTNGDAAHQALKMKRVGLDDLGVPVFSSSEYPAGKPDPRPFLGACVELGVLPRQAVMVGDSADKDVQGALDAGLRAVLLDRHDAHPEFTGSRITTLHDLSFT